MTAVKLARAKALMTYQGADGGEHHGAEELGLRFSPDVNEEKTQKDD